MSVICLNEFQQAAIVRGNTVRGINQTDLARFYCVSRRTIQRVLIDAGVLVYNVHGPKPVPVETPKTVTAAPGFNITSQQRLITQPGDVNRLHEDSKIINAVRSRGLSHVALELKLDSPMKRSDVEIFLARLPDDELATILYTIGLVRVKQHDARATLLRTQKEAANG